MSSTVKVQQKSRNYSKNKRPKSADKALFSWDNFRKYHGDIFGVVFFVLVILGYTAFTRAFFGPLVFLSYSQEEKLAGQENFAPDDQKDLASKITYGFGVLDVFFVVTATVGYIVTLSFIDENVFDKYVSKLKLSIKLVNFIRYIVLYIPYFCANVALAAVYFSTYSESVNLAKFNYYSFVRDLAEKYPYNQVHYLVKFSMLSNAGFHLAMLCKIVLLKMKPEQSRFTLFNSLSNLVVIAVCYQLRLGPIMYLMFFHFCLVNLLRIMFYVQFYSSSSMDIFKKALFWVYSFVMVFGAAAFSATILLLFNFYMEQRSLLYIDVATKNFNVRFFRLGLIGLFFVCEAMLMLDYTSCLQTFFKAVRTESSKKKG